MEKNRTISLKCPECDERFERQAIRKEPTSFQCPKCGAKVKEGWDEEREDTDG